MTDVVATQAQPITSEVATQERPMTDVVATQARPITSEVATQERPIQVQSSTAAALGSRARDIGLNLPKRLSTSNLSRFVIPNKKLLNRVVVSGIPTGTHLNVGFSYRLSGFCVDNLKIHFTPRSLTSKVKSLNGGDKFRLINYGFSEPTLALDSSLLGPLRSDHLFMDGLVVGPYIALKDIPGIKNISLVKSLIEFSEIQSNKNSFEGSDIQKHIQNISKDDLQALSKAVETLSPKQVKTLEKAIGSPVKSLLNQIKGVSQKGATNQGSDGEGCKCCVQNVNFTVGERSVLVSGNGKTSGLEIDRLNKQQGVPLATERVPTTQLQGVPLATEQVATAQLEPEVSNYYASSANSTLGLVFAFFSILAFIGGLLFKMKSSNER